MKSRPYFAAFSHGSKNSLDYSQNFIILAMNNRYMNRALTSNNDERRKLTRQSIEAVKALPLNKLKIIAPELQKEAGIKK